MELARPGSGAYSARIMAYPELRWVPSHRFDVLSMHDLRLRLRTAHGLPLHYPRLDSQRGTTPRPS